MPRQVDPERVQRVQNALVFNRGNQVKAAEMAGVGLTTVKRYMARGLVDPTLKIDGGDMMATLEEMTHDRNERLAEMMTDNAEQALEVVSEGLPDLNAYQAALVAGIMIDKARTIKGQPNTRIEVNVSGDLDVLRRHGLLIEAEAEEIVDAEVVS